MELSLVRYLYRYGSDVTGFVHMINTEFKFLFSKGVSEVFPLVADLISTDWKRLAGALKLRYEDIMRIERDNDSTDSRARAVLEAWKLRDGRKADLPTLIEILQSEGFQSISEAVEDKIKHKMLQGSK